MQCASGIICALIVTVFICLVYCLFIYYLSILMHMYIEYSQGLWVCALGVPESLRPGDAALQLHDP